MTQLYSLKNPKKNIAPLRIRYCESFFDRLRGFTFAKDVPLDQGLVLVEKRDSRVDTAIHMLFVNTDLAVFWIDSSYRVVDKVLAKTWRPFYASKHPARYVLEINPSRFDDFDIGDSVVFKEK